MLSMETYKNLSGLSNVESYQIGEDFIIVLFKKRSNYGANIYKYSYSSAGQQNIEYMKTLAQQGQGLNSFINTHVRKLYESKS